MIALGSRVTIRGRGGVWTVRTRKHWLGGRYYNVSQAGSGLEIREDQVETVDAPPVFAVGDTVRDGQGRSGRVLEVTTDETGSAAYVVEIPRPHKSLIRPPFRLLLTPADLNVT